ncbi:MAG TPA: hypothetical protein VF443_15470, partial [Nitrospira sp.]
EAALYYARMAFRSSLPPLHPGPGSNVFGKDFERWVRFIESSSRSVTRATLAATLRHRQSLHHKQLLLQHLVNDSLWLFPMAATLWFSSQPEMQTKPGIRELATYFCQDMEAQLYPASSPTGRIRGNQKDTTVYNLARNIMQGQYAWLEEGIVPLIDK